MRIGVAGSMQFIEEMARVRDELEKLGHSAFTSSFEKDYVDKTDEQKEELKIKDKNENDAIREFWKPMQEADALIVVNMDKHGIANYVGGNSFLEMGFAHVLNQKIFLMNPAPDMPYYGTEIIAMKPIVINGDLTKVR